MLIRVYEISTAEVSGGVISQCSKCASVDSLLLSAQMVRSDGP
jgi:hypothetical protein